MLAEALALVAESAPDSPYDVMLAALNVVQTVALAYLAARAHADSGSA